MRELVTDFIREHGLLDTDRLEEVFRLEEETGQSFEKIILHKGYMSENDVLRTLQESGFAFRVTAHGARVQGRATEPSVLNALDWFRGRAEELDAKKIIAKVKEISGLRQKLQVAKVEQKLNMYKVLTTEQRKHARYLDPLRGHAPEYGRESASERPPLPD